MCRPNKINTQYLRKALRSLLIILLAIVDLKLVMHIGSEQANNYIRRRLLPCFKSKKNVRQVALEKTYFTVEIYNRAHTTRLEDSAWNSSHMYQIRVGLVVGSSICNCNQTFINRSSVIQRLSRPKLVRNQTTTDIRPNEFQTLSEQRSVLYCIASIHLSSASCSAHQSEALPVRETQRDESSLHRTKRGT